MKPSFILTSLILATVASSPAGQVLQKAEGTPEVQTRGTAEISQDVEIGYGAVAPARMQVSPARKADVSEQNTHLQYILGYAVPERPIVRLGVGYDRYDFGFAGPGLVPGALQSVNLVAGLDLKISDFLIRIETQPGFYGDDHGLRSADFNAPVILGVSYLASKDVQWIIGLSYDGNRANPLLGGIGVRWKMNDRWTLNFIPPDPRLEYKATDDLTLYAGAHLLSSTFRVNKDFGGTRRGRVYADSIVEYTEVRTGAGASWKLAGKGTLDMELGYMAYRDFDYHKVGDDFQTKSGAFYGQLGLKLNF